MNTRKRRVIEAAKDLFIEKGFLETSVMDIINAANISKGTFYNYFASKNECLIAILEENRQEASNRRYELLYGQDPRDAAVLARQIAVLMHINREQNLLAIFESIAHSSDRELERVVLQYHLQELEWLANRLVEVYGEEISPMSYECAVQIFGMIQHTLRALNIAGEMYISLDTVVKMAMRNIDAIIPRMLESKEVLVGVETIHFIKNNAEHKTVSKDMILTQLEGFTNTLTKKDPKDGREYAEYLLQELQEPSPRLFIIESLLTPFRKAYNKTTHAAEAREIANYIWRYVKIEHHVDGDK